MRRLFTALATVGSVATAVAQQQRPNVVVLLADDLQQRALSVMGNSELSTPNIDSIFARGVNFTSCYTNGSLGGALSMPSRAMLLTSRGVYQIPADGHHIDPRHTTLGQWLSQAGYQTFATGKWHSDFASFNRTFASGDNIYFGGMHPYEHGGHTAPRLVHYDSSGLYGSKPFVGTKFSSEMYADAALDFLKNRRQEEPFLLYVAFTSPHDPRTEHPAYGATFSGSSITLPPNFRSEPLFDNGDLTVRDELLVPTPRAAKVVQEEIANYYGMVAELDVQVGRIVAELRREGLAENTILVFASDNGLALGQHGLLGKQSVYDHSMRVPLAIVAPGLRGGGRDGRLCYLGDLMPTIGSLLGLEPPRSARGVSMVGKKERQGLLLGYSSIQRAYIHQGWKYLIFNVGGVVTEQLFNIEKDPWEMNNLLRSPACRVRLAQMRHAIRQQMASDGDFCNLDSGPWWGRTPKITWNQAMEYEPAE
ncbi:MAG: sulfatase-like hydrolase/transferase [Mucinivorans sp.]